MLIFDFMKESEYKMCKCKVNKYNKISSVGILIFSTAKILESSNLVGANASSFMIGMGIGIALTGLILPYIKRKCSNRV